MRRIPDWAFVAIVLGLLGQAMVLYAGFTKWADATLQNTLELKALTVAINTMQIGNAGRDAKLAELERRIGLIEARGK